MKKTITLKKNYEFKYVFNKGAFYGSNLLNVYVLRINQNINKIGIVVGKKNYKAAKRNRVKRLMRESYRLIENNLKVGYSIIIMWKNKKEFEYANFIDIQEQLINILKRAKVFKE